MIRKTALASAILIAALAAILVWRSLMLQPVDLPQASLVRPSVLTTATAVIIPYPNPFSSPQQIMQGIYSADRDELNVQGSVRGVVVPHHIVAAEDIALGIRALSSQDVKDIILLSPDHFNRCPALLCTTNRGFETYFGEVGPSDEAQKALGDSDLVVKDEELFAGEHGIYSVLPFIKHYLPQTKVTPLAMVIDYRWQDRKDELSALLDRIMATGTVLVVSSDFSHYLTLAEADRMDAATIHILQSGDLKSIASLKNPDQSDCPACLWGLARMAQKRGYAGPDLLMHTNSARILNQPDIRRTTSHFVLVWTEK